MPRPSSRPASLSLAVPPHSSSAFSSAVASPSDVESGLSSPASARYPAKAVSAARHHKPSKSVPLSGSEPQSPLIQPSSPEITSLPAFPPSPGNSSRHGRESSKGFFSNLKAAKSSSKVHTMDSTLRQVSNDQATQENESQPKSLYSLRKNTGSTPDLSLSNFDVSSQDDRSGRPIDKRDRPIAASVGSDSALAQSPTENFFKRKPKPRFSNFIKRTQSIRTDVEGKKSKPSSPVTVVPPIRRPQYDGNSEVDESKLAPRTAPIRPDNSLVEMMGSTARGRSADRPSSNHSSENAKPRHLAPASLNSNSNSNSTLSASASGFSREGAGSHLFANIKNTSSRAADGLGRAGKGLLKKIEKERRPSNTAREDEHYVLKNIHLPLIEQTRKTRIAARLEDSKDKTEFWMPSLPWRCIDYLNFRGCEEEGIYRVPGSETQIRHWQRRFDREGDINLFNEAELYDINIVGSMFKSWLRDLPDEIFPKLTQAKIARENPDATTVPQMLRDELSNLPPWNYYLLFAITCHLSLLTAYADKNKMTYGNLCVCFQPCLKIDAFCFRFLVEQWRDCWGQGCYTEKDFLEEEYRLLDGLASSGAESDGSDMVPQVEERSGDSSASSKAFPVRGKPPGLNIKRTGNGTPPVTPAVSAVEPSGVPLNVSQLPELAPVKPISPITAEFKNASEKQAQTSQRA